MATSPNPATKPPEGQPPPQPAADEPSARLSLGTRVWHSLNNESLYACGCRISYESGGPFLIIWCGQPDCLRLAQANVAYTQQQFNWQHAHGGNPVLVQALLRPMVTPLPQVLPPPPPGFQYFGGANLGEDGMPTPTPQAEFGQNLTYPQAKAQPGGGSGEPPEPTGPPWPGGQPDQPGQQPKQPGQQPPHQPPQPPDKPPGGQPPHRPGKEEEPPTKRK